MNRTSSFLGFPFVLAIVALATGIPACAASDGTSSAGVAFDAPAVATLEGETFVSVLSDGRHAYASTRSDGTHAGAVLRIALDDGALVRLVDADPAVGSLAQDEYALYWTNPGTGDVRSIPKVGGRVTTLGRADGLRGNSGAIAVDDAWVYFTTDLAVHRIAKRGGKAEVLVADPSRPDAIVVDRDSVYWVSRGTANDPEARIRAFDKSTGDVRVLGGARFDDTVTHASLAVDDEAVYWIDPIGRRVARSSKADHRETTLAAANDKAIAVTSDGADVFWSVVHDDTDAPSLFRSPAKGGPTAAVHTGPGGSSTVLAVDAKRLTFAGRNGRTLHVVTK